MTFFLDLWHDLREKRLWPVAVGLLCAAIAIPAVLLKPAASPAPPPPITVKPANPDTLPAVSVDTSPTHGSKLATFTARNPFRPLAKLQNSPTAGSSSSSSGSAHVSGTAPVTPPKSSGHLSHTGSTPSSSLARSTTPSSSGSGSGSSSGSTAPSSGSTGTTLKYFTFTADIKFGQVGHEKTLKGLAPGTSIQAGGKEELLFVSLADQGKSAIFFVSDTSLQADGEGQCDSKDKCRFVTLRADPSHDEETFTSTDGTVAFDLQLLKLNKVSASNTKSTASPSQKAGAKSAKAHDGKSIAAAVESPLPSLIAGAKGVSASK